MAQATYTADFLVTADEAAALGFDACYLEIKVPLSAEEVQVDYGVPRSPVWTEYENIQIEYPIQIMDRRFSRRDLAAAIGETALKDLEADVISTATDIAFWE